MSKTLHDKISENLAKKHNVSYNKGKGPDVKSRNQTIEVCTHQSDLYSSIKQVIRYRKPYIATTNTLVNKAIDITKGTGIDVMDQSGKVIKRSRSK